MPESIWDLDFCNHLNINYEPDIDSRHPVNIYFTFITFYNFNGHLLFLKGVL